eukprot:TRINITY_DN2152_c0_g1_i1.p1 TRINITY_DN2152_c0_g1~~TRINITY_DN2152_c0_g1_i1.p1  ORF type:complete len:320 (+),score=41.79 TRINITY_DN2152_c0_g1_i1:82-1041(+)
MFNTLLGWIVAISFGTFLAIFILSYYALCFVLLAIGKIFCSNTVYWRKWIHYCYTQTIWMFLLTNWSRINVKYVGEANTLPKREAALVMSNHQDDLDFGVLIYAYIYHGIRSAETKWIAKRSISWIPFFGWTHYLMGDLYLARKWEDDLPNIQNWLSKFSERGFKRMVIFPEGTRSRDPKKLKASQDFAKKNDLPILNNVLLPRTKGVALIIKYLQDNPGIIDCVYDMTLYYGGGGIGIGRFLRGPSYTDVYIYYSKVLVKDIPKSEEEISHWCLQRFQLKDKLIDYFKSNDHFPNKETENKMWQEIQKSTVYKASKSK